MSKIKKVYSLIKSAEIEAQNIATEFSEASSNILYDFEEMEKLIEKCQELSSASSAKIIAAIREIPIISDIEKAKLTRRILHLGSLWEKSRDLIQPVVSIEP